MIIRVATGTVYGVDAIDVDVEVEIQQGTKPRFSLIGLADNAIRESRERITTAIKYAGFRLPDQIIVNLAPAELKKEGSGFDLPIALGILAASKQIDPHQLNGRVFAAELSLDGRLKPIRGIISLAVQARQRHVDQLILSMANLEQAALVTGIELVAVQTLSEVVAYLNGTHQLVTVQERQLTVKTSPQLQLSDIVDQDSAKRAVVISAAGGHNLLMIGPPGCGKSMLAERMPCLLPPLSADEALEVAKIYSVSNLPIEMIIAGTRPFRSPHHVTSDVGLIGGGSFPRPGEISLAHHGVLFLDELPEFRRAALEALRLPLELGRVQITRAKATLMFPAQFQLIAAMNPCPCGRLNSARDECRCSPIIVQQYLRKLSQPIIDRIDLHVDLKAVPLEQLVNLAKSESTKKEELYRELVIHARQHQQSRQGMLNAHLPGGGIAQRVHLSAGGQKFLACFRDLADITARGFTRILRVARTIADLDRSTEVEDYHLAEAMSFRSLTLLQEYALGKMSPRV